MAISRSSDVDENDDCTDRKRTRSEQLQPPSSSNLDCAVPALSECAGFNHTCSTGAALSSNSFGKSENTSPPTSLNTLDVPGENLRFAATRARNYFTSDRGVRAYLSRSPRLVKKVHIFVFNALSRIRPYFHLRQGKRRWSQNSKKNCARKNFNAHHTTTVTSLPLR
eukprot:1911006-Pleurochrysis_carterae.AAC.1